MLVMAVGGVDEGVGTLNVRLSDGTVVLWCTDEDAACDVELLQFVRSRSVLDANEQHTIPVR